MASSSHVAQFAAILQPAALEPQLQAARSSFLSQLDVMFQLDCLHAAMTASEPPSVLALLTHVVTHPDLPVTQLFQLLSPALEFLGREGVSLLAEPSVQTLLLTILKTHIQQPSIVAKIVTSFGNYKNELISDDLYRGLIPPFITCLENSIPSELLLSLCLCLEEACNRGMSSSGIPKIESICDDVLQSGILAPLLSQARGKQTEIIDSIFFLLQKLVVRPSAQSVLQVAHQFLDEMQQHDMNPETLIRVELLRMLIDGASNYTPSSSFPSYFYTFLKNQKTEAELERASYYCILLLKDSPYIDAFLDCGGFEWLSSCISEFPKSERIVKNVSFCTALLFESRCGGGPKFRGKAEFHFFPPNPQTASSRRRVLPLQAASLARPAAAEYG